MVYKLVSIKPSTQKGKKLMATFSDGSITHFGAKGYEDFTIHNDEDRKDLYLERHRKNEHWNNPKTAGSLSRWILWNKETFLSSVRDYKKRFNL